MTVTPFPQSAKWIALYRVVGLFEAAEIELSGAFAVTLGGMHEKQFWFALSSARWYAQRVTAAGWEQPVLVLQTAVSPETLAKGVLFSDAGQAAVSFTSSALGALSDDAKEHGVAKLERWDA